MSAKRARGQAAVEMALTSLVFVTVIVFGIHFSEIGFLSLKVEEAANAALWESTAQQMHDTFAPDWTLYQGAITSTQSSLQSRYQDFDGLSSATGSTTITEVFTKGDSMKVTCDEPGLSSITLIPPADLAYPSTSASIECSASAKLYGFRIPEHLLDNGGGALFQQADYTPTTIMACSQQRPTSGNCQGSYEMLIDDWGFSGDNESQECPVQDGSGCANSGYYNLVEKPYLMTIGASAGLTGFAATRMVFQLFGLPVLYTEGLYYMSFRGEGTKFQDTLSDSHGDTTWETTPYSHPPEYQNSYNARSTCFLGLGC